MKTAAAFILMASAAQAEAQRVWPGTAASNFSPSIVSLHEPTAPDAVASVTFQNTEVHAADESFALDLSGLVVFVEFDWQADDTQAERVTVYPPDGYIAVPPQITVEEGEAQTLHIFAWRGM